VAGSTSVRSTKSGTSTASRGSRSVAASAAAGRRGACGAVTRRRAHGDAPRVACRSVDDDAAGRDVAECSALAGLWLIDKRRRRRG
jgi:hypothetical protein